MLPKTTGGRRLAGGGAVVLASLLSVFSGRGLQKTDILTAPSYREKGDPAAPVLIAEFSDYECPACRYAEGPVKSTLELYGKDVRLIFKNFPLRQHLWARLAAVAAECAGRQGKFWPYHDILYERQEEWTKSKDPPGLFLDYAKEADADPAAFSACRNDPAVKALIDSEVTEGNNRWVSSTPTFFINRRRFVGASQLSTLGVPWIDKQLKAKR